MRGIISVGLIALSLLAAAAGPAVAEPTADKLREAARVYLQGDYATAFSLWRPLADQGDGMAQTNLGILYARGQGVSQDFVRAYMWLSLAASYGNSEGARYRDIVVGHMTPDQIADAQRLSREWHPR
ncbi:MAG: hypothetical protein WCO00_04220 [Rhodospirillaceae bacterium]